MAVHGVKEEYADTLRATGATEVSVGRFYTWLLLGGLRYRLGITSGISAHAEAQAGFFLVRGPETRLDFVVFNYDVASKVGYSVGLGVDFTRRLGIGVRLVPVGHVTSNAHANTGAFFDTELSRSYADVYASLRVP